MRGAKRTRQQLLDKAWVMVDKFPIFSETITVSHKCPRTVRRLHKPIFFRFVRLVRDARSL